MSDFNELKINNSDSTDTEISGEISFFKERLEHDLLSFKKSNSFSNNLFLNFDQTVENLRNFEEKEKKFSLFFNLKILTGIYENFFLNCELQFTEDFPFEGPKLFCYTEIFHPNIWKTHVCMSILRDEWLPSISLNTILNSFLILMTVDENILRNETERTKFIENGLNTEICQEIKKNFNNFLRKIKSLKVGVEKSSDLL